MAGTALLWTLIAGAALLAVWTDVRLGDRRPQSPASRIGHTAAACAALHVVAAALPELARPEASTAQRVMALFLLFVPGLVYAFLAAFWLARTLSDVARLAGR
jgi:hypothetical protein